MLVWIYGGGFSFGSTSDPVHSGENLKRLAEAESAGEAYATNAGVSSITELRKLAPDNLSSAAVCEAIIRQENIGLNRGQTYTLSLHARGNGNVFATFQGGETPVFFRTTKELTERFHR